MCATIGRTYGFSANLVQYTFGLSPTLSLLLGLCASPRSTEGLQQSPEMRHDVIQIVCANLSAAKWREASAATIQSGSYEAPHSKQQCSNEKESQTLWIESVHHQSASLRFSCRLLSVLYASMPMDTRTENTCSSALGSACTLLTKQQAATLCVDRAAHNSSHSHTLACDINSSFLFHFLTPVASDTLRRLLRLRLQLARLAQLLQVRIFALQLLYSIL